jgi:hypothetical protein
MLPQRVFKFLNGIFAGRSAANPAPGKMYLDPSAARSRRLAARAELTDEECIKRRETRRQYRRFAQRRRLVDTEDLADHMRHGQ